MSAGFTAGRYTQAGAASTVAACEVTEGTVLTVHVSADGRKLLRIDSEQGFTVCAKCIHSQQDSYILVILSRTFNILTIPARDRPPVSDDISHY